MTDLCRLVFAAARASQAVPAARADSPSPATRAYTAAQAAGLDALAARYGWFTPLLVARQIVTGEPDRLLAVAAPWRAQSSLLSGAADAAVLRHVAPQELIDRFLREEELRIVAEDGDVDQEVQTEACLDDDDRVVTEELAAIYRSQGLSERAVEIYRQLILLNPEKSVYFAELIAGIDNK